jgi:hypothetical protein
VLVATPPVPLELMPPCPLKAGPLSLLLQPTTPKQNKSVALPTKDALR